MERYEAYKDSGVEWIGVMPSTWICVNLGSVTKQRKNPNKEGEAETVLSLSYGNVKRRVLDNSGLLPESFSTYNIIEDGDVVLRLTDLQNDQRSLRVGLCHEQGIITSAYTTLMPHSVDSRYLFYSLAVFDYWKGFYGLAGGVRQSLTFNGIRNLRFPLPSQNEQQAIADYLDAKTAEIDALAADCEREVELLQEYRKAVISETVNKGLNPDTSMKDSGIEWIGAIPDNWKLRRLKLLGTTRSGMGNKKPDDFGSGKPFLSYKDVYTRESFCNATGLVESTEEDRSKFSVERGDAFFTGSSETIEELGFSSVCLSTVPNATFNGFTIRFRPRGKDLWPEFAAYLFRSDVFRRYLKQRDNSITRANLSQQTLGDAITVLPSVQEQHAIANYLNAKTAEIDAFIDAKQSMADKLREYRRSLISEAVTGKFKVPGV